jgi:hypothetical protein
MNEAWIHIIADAAVVSLLGYNLSIFKDLAKKLIEDNQLAHDRINLHDRIVSEEKSKSFDSAAIVKGLQSFPVIKPRRES